MRRASLVPALVVALLALGVATWLLVRVLDAASSINAKAATIARNGRGINIATDSVIQLSRTNRIAASILRSAQPLSGKLTLIVDRAHGINGTAGSIDTTAGTINTTAGGIDKTAGAINTTAGAINTTAGAINGTAGSINGTAGSIKGTAGTINGTAGAINGTAGAINGTAGRIDSTARGINGRAAQILDVSTKIDTDVKLINVFLVQSIGIASRIRGDTGNIVVQARLAHHFAACIDKKVAGMNGNDGHCETRQPQ